MTSFTKSITFDNVSLVDGKMLSVHGSTLGLMTGQTLTLTVHEVASSTYFTATTTVQATGVFDLFSFALPVQLLGAVQVQASVVDAGQTIQTSPIQWAYL